MILIPAALYRAAWNFILYVEAEFIAGYRPMWWRILSIGFLLVGYVFIPIIAIWNARRILSDLSRPQQEFDHYSHAVDEIEKEKRA